MGNSAASDSAITEPLKTADLSRLAALEKTIKKSLQSFFDVGNALKEIRDNRYYRATHRTFQEYCKDRWGFERRAAYQHIDAAVVVNNVRNCAQMIPTNEWQCRPLVSLAAEHQQAAWKAAVESAGGAPVTARIVAEAVAAIVSVNEQQSQAETASRRERIANAVAAAAVPNPVEESEGEIRELALFAGAGGGILASHLLGWRTVCAVERDHYAACVLAMRQNDGSLRPFPIWDDVNTFDGTRWRGRVDVVSGGFPCQDISVNGNGAGITGERSGLWRQMARIIREVGPRFVLVENSPALTYRGLGVVLGDLAEMGFDAKWGCVSARDVGAPHKRERIWIAAHAAMSRRDEDVPRRNATPLAMPGSDCDVRRPREWWRDQSRVQRVGNGVANRVDRLTAIGNGQVPAVARYAWQLLGGD